MSLSITLPTILGVGTFLFTCVMLPLVTITLYISRKFAGVEQTQAVTHEMVKANKEELMGVFKLTMSDEALKREERFAELKTQIQSNRHKIAGVEQKVNALWEERRKG